MKWKVIRGDIDGDIIGQVEAKTYDEAWVLAKDTYDNGWRERTSDQEEEGGYNTWNCVYIREVPREKHEKKDAFLACWEDAVSGVCCYDRKEDEELDQDDVDELLNNNHITIDEITQIIYKNIKENFPGFK